MTLTISRRSFIGSAGATGLATSVPLGALAGFAGAAPPQPTDGLLLVLFLRGGNDWLNTVGPFNNGTYNDKRGSLAISPSGSYHIANGLYFHPNLTFLNDRYQAGELAIVQGVGEPSVDRSHVSQTSTFMTAIDKGLPRSTGWLGRYLDTMPLDVIGASVGGGVAQQIRGTDPRVVGVGRSERSLLPLDERAQPTNRALRTHVASGLSGAGGLYADALKNAARFSGSLQNLYPPVFATDSDDFVADMQRAAGILNLGLGVRVISATLSGWDTHSDQDRRHPDLLARLDRGLQAFHERLFAALHGQTCVLVVSEFGRRFEKNGSDGTDHGSAGSALLLGSRVTGGLHGSFPSLHDLDGRGDMKFTTDLRKVYSDIAATWLKTDPVPLLSGNYGGLDLFRSGPLGTGVAGFLDVDSGRFYAGALKWAAASGIVTGTSAVTFEPDRPMTRAEFATVLHRYVGPPAPGGANPFSDVPSGSWFNEPVRWMVGQDITTGTSPTTFDPNRSVTRGEAATFMWRMAGRPNRNGSTGFVDVPAGRFYSDAVRWMALEEITTGTTSTTFSPNDLVTRAQAITFLWRYDGSPST